ncbi:class I SAM-dependent methyltransferase [Occultella kanbiaonis]|uniref:class I SAM-dependent methyltransferase n=1 Tax=Occultella kanbiaonis TaxID=2675754 RepID=UPI00143D75EC|nr:class I SAM-dependent methyltransferase [Occultella kanbiaonis]
MTQNPSTRSDVQGDPPLAPRALLRWDVVSRLLRDLKPRTVLEIGCGLGAFGARIAPLTTYVAVEPDATSYASANGVISPRGGTVINGTDQSAPAGQTYDLVCAFEVLEHIDEDEAALRTWVEHVKPGGRIMLSVPAFQDRFGPMDTMSGHFRRYSPEEMSALLTKVGMVRPQVTVYAWPLGYALEAVRNRMDSKKLAGEYKDASVEDLTAASGRTNQPRKRLIGLAIQTATAPFRWLQRLRPTTGTGLVVVAERPA